MVIAPNAFKGSLSAGRAAEAIARGVKAVFPEAELYLVPMADGGDGTTECLIRATGGRIFRKRVAGPLGEPVEGFWGLTGGGRTAVVEVAAASGLALVPADRRDPLGATSPGTGELIREALGSGCREIFIGLGGSAKPMPGQAASSPGVRLLDSRGQEIGRGALQVWTALTFSSLDPGCGRFPWWPAAMWTAPVYGLRERPMSALPRKGPGSSFPSWIRVCARFAAVVERDLQVRWGRWPAGAPGEVRQPWQCSGGQAGFGVRKLSADGLPELLRQEDINTDYGRREINPQCSGKSAVGLGRLARQQDSRAGPWRGIRLDPRKRTEPVFLLMAIVDAPMWISPPPWNGRRNSWAPPGGPCSCWPSAEGWAVS